MPELIFLEAFNLWGTPTTWLEIVAFVLALAMVGCNIREIHWGWPLAIASSLLYGALFWRSKLYGDASLQVLFVTLGLWGWVQWLRGRRADGSALVVARLGRQNALFLVAISLALWLATGLFLQNFTDSDVPWWDAFPTALSVVGQWLLARKYIENWLAWLAVNIASVGLFAYKGLWLTLLLYALFVLLSVAGWRAWRRKLPSS